MVRHYEINQTPNAVGGATKRWYTFQGVCSDVIARRFFGAQSARRR